MRLWHILFGVFLSATVLAIAREEVGRVAIVVFATTISEVFLGTASLLMLFRTFGAIGMARNAMMYVEAIAATIAVLFVGTAAMAGVLYIGIFLLTLVTKY